MTMLLGATHHVSAGVTILFSILLLGLITCLAFEEKLHAKKSVIAGVFAIICLLAGAVCGILPFDEVVIGSHEVIQHGVVDGELRDDEDESIAEFHLDASADAEHNDESDDAPLHVDGHRIGMPVYIPAIDWGVIAIILGSSLFVDVTSKSGLFTWIAIKMTKASGGDPRKLLYYYGLLTVVFSAVLNNVTAMIIIGSLTAVSLERLNRRDKLLGFLLLEGLLTNVGGMLTLISSVPNIIVGSAAHISFVQFFIKASPYVLVTSIVTLWIGARWFGIERLESGPRRDEARQLVAGFDEKDGVESWGFFWFGAAMLALFILAIATTSVLPYVQNLEMGFVALAFAGVMLLRYRAVADSFYKAIDWDLLGFFMSLFVVIYVMEYAQVLGTIGHGIEMVLIDIRSPHAHWIDTSVLLIGSAVASSVTDNIPLAAMLANILATLGAPVVSETSQETGLWWAVIFGANLGGNITPIGSASTLVAVTIIHRHKLPMSFAGFVKVAAPFAIVQIVMALVYVLVFLR